MTWSAVAWRDGAVVLLDQRRLPTEELYVVCNSVEAVAAGIKDMVVRGAPAIGITAAYGVALAARLADDLDTAVPAAIAVLGATRPTAVNLFWALDRMRRVFDGARGGSRVDLVSRLAAEAVTIHEEDIAVCRAIGDHGASLIPDGATVLTHCNAGALATGGYGTALAVIRSAVAQGKKIKVFADETRPYLQGARLTSWELQKDGIDVTVITDNMAGWMMAQGLVTCAVVGSDRTVANGDVCNKIGTYTVAVLCHHHGLPFYAAVPISTLDLTMKTGAEIPIEERHADEVTRFTGVRVVPEGVPVRNPSFDVTPNHLVTGIITERGVVKAPFGPGLRALVG
jgi:methylthioribose-1-phosphate isomerase